MVVAEEARILRCALASKWLWGLLLAAAVLIALAYQVKQEYTLDVGGGYDCPYLGPHEYCLQVPPKDPAWSDAATTLDYQPAIPAENYTEYVTATTTPMSSVTYRTNKGQSEAFFPGLGNQPYIVQLYWAASPEASIPVTITINAQMFTATLTPYFKLASFPTIRFGRTNADVQITLQTPAGVRVSQIRILPSDYNLTTLVVPSLEVALSLLAALLLLYLITYRVMYGGMVSGQQGEPPPAPKELARWVVVLTSFSLIAIITLLAVNRLSITSFAPQLAVVLLWAWVLAEVVILLTARFTIHDSQFTIAVGIFAFAFAVRFGGMVYPQFITSDLTFHAHHIDDMVRFFGGQGGNFYFDGALPNGVRVPYPNAYYVLLAPFEWLLGGTTEAGKLILRFFSAILDASTVLLLYALGRRFGEYAGLAAGLLYATAPAPFQLFSAGNHSNIFAQVMFIAALVAMVNYLTPTLTLPRHGGGEETPSPYPLPQGARGSVSLSPYPLPQGARGSVSRDYSALSTQHSALSPHTSYLVAFFVFFSLTSLGHYGMFIAAVGVVLTVLAVWLAFAGELRGRIWPLLLVFGASLLLAYLLYYVHFNAQIAGQISAIINRKGQASGFDLPHLLGDILRWQGWLVLPLAALGIAMLLKRGWRAERKAAKLVLGGWLLACIPLALTALFDRDTIRYNYLLLPALCICGGFAVQWLATLDAAHPRRNRAIVFTAFIILALISVILSWGDLIFNQYH